MCDSHIKAMHSHSLEHLHLEMTSGPQAVLQLRAQKSSKTRDSRTTMPWLTLGPAAMANDALPWCQPISGDHVLLGSSPETSDKSPQDGGPISVCLCVCLSVSPLTQGPFFCLCSLFPEPISLQLTSTSGTF